MGELLQIITTECWDRRLQELDPLLPYWGDYWLSEWLRVLFLNSRLNIWPINLTGSRKEFSFFILCYLSFLNNINFTLMGGKLFFHNFLLPFFGSHMISNDLLRLF